MKNNKILFYAACFLLLVGCSGIYEPGDMYKGDGFEGIVVTVDEDNQPLMVMSLEEASSLTADSALRWAEGLGEGWRLPTKKEIAQIERVRSLINNTLKRKKLSTVFTDFTYYWSSTTCSESHCYACGPDGVGCYFKENDDPSYRARGVRGIEN